MHTLLRQAAACTELIGFSDDGALGKWKVVVDAFSSDLPPPK